MKTSSTPCLSRSDSLSNSLRHQLYTIGKAAADRARRNDREKDRVIVCLRPGGGWEIRIIQAHGGLYPIGKYATPIDAIRCAEKFNGWQVVNKEEFMRDEC